MFILGKFSILVPNFVNSVTDNVNYITKWNYTKNFVFYNEVKLGICYRKDIIQIASVKLMSSLRRSSHEQESQMIYRNINHTCLAFCTNKQRILLKEGYGWNKWNKNNNYNFILKVICNLRKI